MAHFVFGYKRFTACASTCASFYKQGEYEEFCAGPHISNVCQIKAIKLLSVAGAYWRGNEKNQMLTRIYGISFPKAAKDFFPT